MAPSSDEFTIAPGYGWGQLIGGAFMIVVGWSMLKTGSPAEWPPAVARLFAIGLAAGGVAFMLSREGVTFDRRRRTCTKWRGLLRPMFRTTHAVPEGSRLWLERRMQPARRSGQMATVYVIGADTPSGSEDLADSPHFPQARRWARAIAGHLELPLEDRSRVAPAAEGPSKAGAADPLSSAPPSSRVRMTATPEGYVLSAGATGPRPLHFGLMGASAAALGLLFYFFVVQPHRMSRPDEAFAPSAGVWLAFLIPLAAVLAVCVRSMTMRHRIEMTPEQLGLTSQWLLGRRARTIGREAIEEIDVDESTRAGRSFHLGTTPPWVLIVHTPSASYDVGAGLEPGELMWMRDALCAYYGKGVESAEPRENESGAAMSGGRSRR